MGSLFWPIFIIAATAGVGVSLLLDIGGVLQAAIGFPFLLICPGMAYIRLLKMKERFTELILAIALSMALGTIISTALVLADVWAPAAAVSALMVISLVGAALQIAHHRSDRITGRRNDADNSEPGARETRS